ncbi:MAG: GIY-YIG nuclease family protein [Alphaproteobacteria bacterium]
MAVALWKVNAGHIYVLTHPSDPNLYKIGVTIREPVRRLAQHNSDFTKAAGRIVKETGQKWELKEYHAVPDPYWAERAFWGNTPVADIPFRGGVEVEKMYWEDVQRGLEAAKQAGVRPDPALAQFPDWVYEYTASMRRRLEGRDITLQGYVKSMVSGKANFRCANGHEWRTRAMAVAEGEGCPKCGIGESSPEKIRKKIGAGAIHLLTHPRKPGLVGIGMASEGREWPWNEWEIHRTRNVEEMGLAETLIWELLGQPLPHDREPIKIDLSVAEDAFRKLIYVMREEIAFEEQRKEALKVATG